MPGLAPGNISGDDSMGEKKGKEKDNPKRKDCQKLAFNKFTPFLKNG